MNSNDFFAPPPPARSALSDAISQARAIIETEIAPKVPGLSVAVSVGGAMVWSQQFGYTDLSAKTPVTPTTRFRIGSVSKPLTGAGLALLVERGQLDMDAPVQKYIPDFPQKGEVITPVCWPAISRASAIIAAWKPLQINRSPTSGAA